MISELLLESVRQPALWGDLDRERRVRAWKTVDQVNATLGRGTVRILNAGAKDGAWKPRAEHLSPRWNDCPSSSWNPMSVGGKATLEGPKAEVAD